MHKNFITENFGMSQGEPAAKRGKTAAPTYESYGKTTEKIEEALISAKTPDGQGEWIDWHPKRMKCSDEISALNLSIEEYIIDGKETYILRCKQKNGVSCAICKSKVFFFILLDIQ